MQYIHIYKWYKLARKLPQEFFDGILDSDYRTQRFTELGRMQGMEEADIKLCLAKKKARYVAILEFPN